jgi:hypothetical protein
MRITFLHLSDLHYRPKTESSDVVFRRFVEDAREQSRQFDNLFLVFSGDLVHAGGEQGLYDALLSGPGSALDGIGLSRDRRICVPGNHDVAQEIVEKKIPIQQGSLGTIKSEEVFNNTLPQLKDAVFSGNFDRYTTAEAKFADYSCCQSGLGGTGWELKGVGVGIYCLNSALCSFGGAKGLDGIGRSNTRSIPTSRCSDVRQPATWSNAHT